MKIMLTMLLVLIATSALAQTQPPPVSFDRLTVTVGPNYEWSIDPLTRPSSDYRKDWTLGIHTTYALTGRASQILPNQSTMLFGDVGYSSRDRLRKPLRATVGLAIQLWGPKEAK
jgi:hypothetical protein